MITPKNLITGLERLFFSYEKPDTCTYSVVMHDLIEKKNRYSHCPDDDHTSTINCISVSEPQQIFISGSVDGTIKVGTRGDLLLFSKILISLVSRFVNPSFHSLPTILSPPPCRQVWNMVNLLVRNLILNTIPTAICFGNHRGDILLCVKNEIRKIEFEAYLPEEYKKQMIGVQYPIEVSWSTVCRLLVSLSV